MVGLKGFGKQSYSLLAVGVRSVSPVSVVGLHPCQSAPISPQLPLLGWAPGGSLTSQSGTKKWGRSDFEDGSKNVELLDALKLQQKEIEQELGDALEWERLDTRRASRIGVYTEGSIEMTASELASIREWAILRLLGFRKVLGPKIKKILSQ